MSILSRTNAIPKYEQFLTKHGLLSYNPDDYSKINKIDFIRDTLGEIDTRLFSVLYDDNFLPDEIKEALSQEKTVREKAVDIHKDLVTQPQEFQPTTAQVKSENVSVPVLESEFSSSVYHNKISLLNYAIVFLIVLVALGILWRVFPDKVIFILLISASVIVFLSIVISFLKHEGKISDNAFVNAIGKITEILKSFSKK